MTDDTPTSTAGSEDHVYKSGRGLTVRAVRRSVRHLGYDYPEGWMCCHCGGIPASSPPGAPPRPECWNCGASLREDADGPQRPTKEERLTMQVVHLKCCILAQRKREGVRDPANCSALTETWEAFGGPA